MCVCVCVCVCLCVVIQLWVWLCGIRFFINVHICKQNQQEMVGEGVKGERTSLSSSITSYIDNDCQPEHSISATINDIFERTDNANYSFQVSDCFGRVNEDKKRSASAVVLRQLGNPM